MIPNTIYSLDLYCKLRNKSIRVSPSGGLGGLRGFDYPIDRTLPEIKDISMED